MTIGVDYRLATQHPGGMGVYIRNLIKGLQKSDKENRYILLDNNQKTISKSTLGKLWGVVSEQYWIQIHLLGEITKKRMRILFSPNPPVPIFAPVPIILTIPDMAFYFDQQIKGLVRIYLFLTYLVSAHKADVITTFSQASKKDIQRILKVKNDKVIVIPLAAADIFHPGSKVSARELQTKYKITKPYILSTPGSLIPRKNVAGLLQAFKLLPPSLRNNYQLVVCAITDSSYYNDIHELTEELGLAKNVIYTGYIEPESQQLVELYRGATIFVFPSLYEGFGLPPLEAMKCGIPVIVGNNSSLPEVVNGAGILVDNLQQLAKAIVKIHSNKVLYRRLKTAGIKRAKVYSWTATAKMFKKVVATSSPSLQ